MSIFILTLALKTRPPEMCSHCPILRALSMEIIWFLTVTLSYNTCGLEGLQAETTYILIPSNQGYNLLLRGGRPEKTASARGALLGTLVAQRRDGPLAGCRQVHWLMNQECLLSARAQHYLLQGAEPPCDHPHFITLSRPDRTGLLISI